MATFILINSLSKLLKTSHLKHHARNIRIFRKIPENFRKNSSTAVTTKSSKFETMQCCNKLPKTQIEKSSETNQQKQAGFLEVKAWIQQVRDRTGFKKRGDSMPLKMLILINNIPTGWYKQQKRFQLSTTQQIHTSPTIRSLRTPGTTKSTQNRKSRI